MINFKIGMLRLKNKMIENNICVHIKTLIVMKLVSVK